MKSRMEVVPKCAGTQTNAPTDGFDGIDHLSSLPNDILCHVLSFLPTKYAVGTSVLSKRWKNLVPLIPNLQIILRDTFLHNPNSVSDMTMMNFKSFVDRLLNVTLHDVTCASCFHLHCEKFNKGQDIAKWIDAALRLNVKSMALLIREPMNSNFIFDSLFWANITSLVLMLDFTDTAPEFRFSMPNLKVLSVLYMGANDVNIILEGSPGLEHLELYNCHAYPEEVLCIRNPLLRILKFYNRKDYFDGDLEISAPRLEYLLYDGFHPNHYIVQRLASLQRADLSLNENYDIYLYGLYLEFSVLLDALSCIKWLWVSETVIKMLCLRPIELSKFENLVCMEIDKMDAYAWGLLRYMLFYVPTFKCLSVKSGFDLESYRKFRSSLNLLPNSQIKTVNVFVIKRGPTGFDMVFRGNTEGIEAAGQSLPEGWCSAPTVADNLNEM